ncbi:hypothetical protein I79_009838 [Cricetulus griseus]|uniref:Uncharacterized protein n=1 Tax=Cricetulus griseus TaxID=10029 RepID=G3HGU7_CRIGR|nr:hypothetical protein I79_009838 [Cricetulus griseus]
MGKHGLMSMTVFKLMCNCKTVYTKQLQKGPRQSSWMFLFCTYDSKKDNPFTHKHSRNDVHATLCTNLHI